MADSKDKPQSQDPSPTGDSGPTAPELEALRRRIDEVDARQRFDIAPDMDRKRAGEMPPGCDCARVVLGKIYPNQCILYGRACTPRKPIGPCMVSDEGACRIWWAAGYRDNEWEGREQRQSDG